MPIGMFDSFITGHWFSAEAKRLWSDEATLQSWLDVEAALAQAQAAQGLIPAEAAATITGQAQASRFDTRQLAEAIAFAQHPLVPVLHRFEQLCGEPAAGYLHWGATTQNIFDTAAALQMHATHRLLLRELDGAITAIGALATRHRSTPMAGRTHGQHALPMSFGYKLAGWIDELDRDRQRLQQRLAAAFPASMGGAIGTFAAMGPRGPAVEAGVAELLGLQPAGLPLRGSYDRACDYVQALGLLAGTAQKIAQDLVFLQRSEIGEVSEAFHHGKVGSSTMAQKRNPSSAQLLASLARLLRLRVPGALEAMVRSDEGDAAATNVTDVLLPEIALLGASLAGCLCRLARGLQVDAAAMARNLALGGGLINTEALMMRLTPRMGRHRAHRLLYEVAQQAQSARLPFRQALLRHPAFAEPGLVEELLQALEPAAYLGESVTLTDATVARVPGARPAPPPA
ncbi:adenylosuccinate lyase family protein [Aquabacterium sp.]|uniref:class-II fumarase/aspartase family protein n=1 Tax=Aquabacterium sp. TaxID=1872578 RepID=UPI0037848BF5